VICAKRETGEGGLKEGLVVEVDLEIEEGTKRRAQQD